MNDAIKVTGLCKHYKDFSLDNISFTLPRGSIVGFVGENGAGKTTTLKAILNLIRTDGGSIELLGQPHTNPAIRSKIGVVFEDAFFYESMNPAQIKKCLAGLQPTFDGQYYDQLMKQFNLPTDKKIKDMSRGMRVKTQIACAIAHHPELLVLDEATSGLDPVMRSDILDLLLEFIQDEQRSVLMSSHITGDLQKIADSILYIRQGKLMFQMNKDDLLDEYGLVKCSAAQLSLLPASLVAASVHNSFGTTALVKHRAKAQALLPDALVDPASIDDIMEFYAKGEKS